MRVFISVSANDVGYVDADVPKRITREAVEDELSTQPGMRVKVTPGGRVLITKVQDPDWDNEKDEPFVEGSDDEEDKEDKDESENKKNKTGKGQKRKLEEAKKTNKDVKNAKNGKKQKGGPEQQAEDESDDDIDQAEIDYMKRVADEEEEIERKEAQEKVS